MLIKQNYPFWNNHATHLQNKKVTFDVIVRFFAIILSLFILILAVIPCSDVHASNLMDEGTNLEIGVQQGHSHNTGDNCTLFCNCSCCGFHVTVSELFSIIQKKDISLSDLITPYTSNNSFELNAGVWHPPTLS